MFYLYGKETKNYIVFHLPKDLKFKSFFKIQELKVYFFES